jgi:TonB family protein
VSRIVTALLISASFCAAQIGQGQQAEDAIAAQLQQDPNNVALLLKLGAMKMADAGAVRDPVAKAAAFDASQSCYERVVTIDSNNTAALYSLGVLGWMRVFPELRAARAQSGMDPESPAPLRDTATRAVLNARFAGTLRDSIDYLNRVLAIDPQSNDAMAYLNLVYRAKADLEPTPQAAGDDIAAADGWVRKALDTARAKNGSGGSYAPPPPPPPQPPPSATGPGKIRVSGNVQAVNLIDRVDPVYPELAKRARIQGTVRFNAVIATDGTLANLTVVSGHPMLVQAALDAVRKWRYKPTLLNNAPVEVITTIDVDFSLPSN